MMKTFNYYFSTIPMRKYLLLLLLFFAKNQTFGQKTDYYFSVDKINLVDGIVTYTLIDTITSNNVNKVHSKVLEWLSMNFRSSKRVIDLDDTNENKIVAKGFSNESYHYRLIASDLDFKYEQYFTMNFSLKDNKYRLVISEFTAKGIVNPLTYMDKQDLHIEEYLRYVPTEYNFKKLTGMQRLSLYIS